MARPPGSGPGCHCLCRKVANLQAADLRQHCLGELEQVQDSFLAASRRQSVKWTCVMWKFQVGQVQGKWRPVYLFAGLLSAKLQLQVCRLWDGALGW